MYIPSNYYNPSFAFIAANSSSTEASLPFDVYLSARVEAALVWDVYKRQEFIDVPSPVSYYEEVFPLLEKKAAEFGLEVTYDRKRTAYITLEGEDNSKTVCMGAHLDTIGLVVRHIDDNGHLIVRQLGGVNYLSLIHI